MNPESNSSSEDLAGLQWWSRFVEQLDPDKLHSLLDETKDWEESPFPMRSPWHPFLDLYENDDHPNAHAPSGHRGLDARQGTVREAHDSDNVDLAFMRPPSRRGRDDDDDDHTSFTHRQPAAQHGREGESKFSAKASFDRHQGPSQIARAQAVPSSIELPPQQERSSGDSRLELQDAISYKESTRHIRVPPNPFVQRGMLQDLPILFGTKAQKTFFAIPDTGATLNVVNYTFLKAMSSDDISDMVAARQGDTDSADLEMANGDVVSTMGQVTLSCAFLDTPSAIMDIAFHVCKSLAENVQVVFGKPFLDATSTLTAHSHRLIERSVGRFPKVMRMCIGQSDVRLNMRILMNTTVTLAYPDTGSEIDLISRDFVGQIGLPVSELEICDPYRVQFATGGPQKLLGKILVKISIPEYSRTKGDRSLASSKLILDLEQPDSSSDEEQPISDLKLQAGGSHLKFSQERAFYVVGNLYCNITLGQAFLHAVDAFKAQKHAFLQSDSVKFRNTLNGIFVLSDAQSRWVEFWSKYTKRKESDAHLPGKSQSPVSKQDVH
jgi:hypothetical protein